MKWAAVHALASTEIFKWNYTDTVQHVFWTFNFELTIFMILYNITLVLTSLNEEKNSIFIQDYQWIALIQYPSIDQRSNHAYKYCVSFSRNVCLCGQQYKPIPSGIVWTVKYLWMSRASCMRILPMDMSWDCAGREGICEVLWSL